jgi:hypothetical protein
MEGLIKIVIGLVILSLTQCKDECLKSDRCNLEPEEGPCYALFTRYYYDKKAKQCKSFTYGGCGGVVPFQTLEECKDACGCDVIKKRKKTWHVNPEQFKQAPRCFEE